ncbi:MAG: LacI family DNA-binding transcriptional regulator, partial [Algicola sp.]|nr:LacI family DNA-binding transcriptional regulator [Algicola sp.]
MTQPAGIKDIAKRAGVSTATVSRTLRNPQLVSENTREKVMEAVKACNYRPNQMGINLRTKRSGNIVAIIPDITNPFNAGVIKAIERVAQSKGYSVLLGDTQGDDARVSHYAGMVASRQADGIILFSQFMPFDLDKADTEHKNLPPLVNSCEDTGFKGINRVMIDNKAAAITAVQHLIELGHTRIGCITGHEQTN